MKFIHTADWQIGMKAAHVGNAGVRVREERINTISKIIELSRIHQVDFILIAGDTFESNAIDRKLIQRVADIINQSFVPVYIIPGNHDPYVPGSVWEHPAWESCNQIKILTQNEPVSLSDGILYPCPLRQKYSFSDPTEWINAVDEKNICIGLAHGTVIGVEEEPDTPISREAAYRTGLDYIALGHWHSYATYKDDAGAERMAYSGTHETTKFGERDSGNILIIDIQERGAIPEIQVIATGGLNWQIIEKDLRSSEDVIDLKKEIENLSDSRNTLLDIRLTGLLPGDVQDELTHIQDILSSRFLYSNFDISRLRPVPEDDRWIEFLPAGYLRKAGERLRDFSNPEYLDDRPEGATVSVASRALLELYTIAKEVHK